MTIIPNFLRFNFIIGYLGHRIYPFLPFLLPHDNSYYGIRYLIDNKHGLFLDVGANDGISAMGFRKINKTYRIISFEPNKTLEPRLKGLKKKDRLFDYLMAGVGKKAGKSTLYIPFYHGLPIDTVGTLYSDIGKTILSLQFTPEQMKKVTFKKQTIEIVKLDDLHLIPDIIKMDTEGSDNAILCGARKTINKYRPYFIIECTPFHLQPQLKFFRLKKYDLFVYDFKNNFFYPFNLKKETTLYYEIKKENNIFCIPQEKVAGLVKKHVLSYINI